MRIFLIYCKEVFLNNTFHIILFIFDVIGIVFIFLPFIPNYFLTHFYTLQLIGGIIFLVSFSIANFRIYKKFHQTLNEFNEKLIMIDYYQQKSDYAEVINLSDDILTDISAMIKYFDKKNLEVFLESHKFYRRMPHGVWDEIHEITHLDKKERFFIELPSHETLGNSKISICLFFSLPRNSNKLKIEKEIDILPNVNNWLIS